MKAVLWVMLVSHAAVPQKVATERVETSPGISESAMRESLARVTGALERCVPELLPDTPELDDRVSIRFTVDKEGRLKQPDLGPALKVKGLLDRQCVNEQAKDWAFPKPSTGQRVDVEWSLRVQLDRARSNALRTEARQEVKAYCDAFKKRLQKTPKAPWIAGQALVDFLRLRGVKVTSDDQEGMKTADLTQARLTSYGRRWVEAMQQVLPPNWRDIVLSTGEELGDPNICPELASWQPNWDG
ncbi:hypothetical protein [Myxococcus sp. Y35]|uniref:hypothetical protein n=1 Tax=Pseudomyxococcus flavus TaxID=3115648 RepID=UPI003CEA6D5C